MDTWTLTITSMEVDGFEVVITDEETQEFPSRYTAQLYLAGECKRIHNSIDHVGPIEFYSHDHLVVRNRINQIDALKGCFKEYRISRTK